MIAIPKDEKREQKTCSSYKTWILPSLASLALHVFGFNLANTALQIPSEIEQNRIERIETERKLEQILACTPNPQREISPEEQSFIDSLVLDLQDKHLDSMPLGEYFVRSETFVHNRNIGCLEDTWLVENELKDFNDYRSMVLNEDFVNHENPVERSIQIAKFLHSGIYPYSEDDPKVKQLVNEHGNKVLDKPILFYPSNSGSSWFLKTKKGERSNCKSGTKWFAAITSEDPALKDKVYNLVFDNHILSVVNLNGTEYFFENLSDSPFPIEQDLSDNPARRPNEMFVVEYLVASGINLELLPLEFYSWYKQKPKSGIININTDEYGLEAKVGARSQSIADELFNIPISYQSLSFLTNSKVVALDLNYSQIDWVKVFVEYTKSGIPGDLLESSYYYEQMSFILDRVVESTSDPDLISISKRTRSDIKTLEKALLDSEVQYWTNPENFSLPIDNYSYEEARLDYFLLKQREAHIEAILLDSNPDQVLANQVLFDSSILDTTSDIDYNQLVFFGITDQYFKRFHNYPEIPEVLDLHSKLVDTGLRLYTSEETYHPLLVKYLIKLGQISDPQINERIITQITINPSDGSKFALASSAIDYPSLLIFPEMYSVLEERLNNHKKSRDLFCNINFPTYSAEERKLAQDLYDSYCNH